MLRFSNFWMSSLMVAGAFAVLMWLSLRLSYGCRQPSCASRTSFMRSSSTPILSSEFGNGAVWYSLMIVFYKRAEIGGKFVHSSLWFVSLARVSCATRSSLGVAPLVILFL